MIHWWFALSIAGGTMVIDWVIFLAVGNHVAGKLTRVAEEAVLKGADDVKSSLFALIPQMIPKVIAALRSPSEEVEKDHAEVA